MKLWCFFVIEYVDHKPQKQSRHSKRVFNTLRPRQNGRHFADDTFKYIFLNENVIISAKISLKFVPKGPINNIAALVQIMAWRRPGDEPLSEPMMVRLPTHICVTRPQWVNSMSIIIDSTTRAILGPWTTRIKTALLGDENIIFGKATLSQLIIMQRHGNSFRIIGTWGKSMSHC